MTTQTIFYIIIALVVFEFSLTKILWYLNTLNWSNKLPKELKDVYDEKKYSKSMKYEKAKYKFWNISSLFSFLVMLLVLIFGWFGWLDNFVRMYTESQIIIALYFFWIIMFVQIIISIPFSYYSTFIIEEKFGFNKMTKKIFFLDLIKTILLSIIIWWILISLLVFLYLKFSESFWLYAWWTMTFISVFFMIFYSSLIVPLFNKQTPLEKWKLRNTIEKFSLWVWFKLNNIYVIDWSKRSSKANAYFSGFWPKKRIVLYDTLIKDLSIEELVAVLAHEIGHYKKRHTLQMLVFSIIQSGFMLYVFWLVLQFDDVSMALWAKVWSFHVWVVAFGVLFTPISIIIWLLGNVLSRKNEYEADNFAWKYLDPELLVSALKKLSVNNLSNLRPHPIYELFYYSHPSVLKRFNNLRKICK